jgi:tRNA-Thr(GGU) m(6)t(6)A37 methyltransferase TsaA
MDARKTPDSPTEKSQPTSENRSSRNCIHLHVEEDSPASRQFYEVVPIGWIESSLIRREEAPRQGREGAPPAWLVFEPEVGEGIRDLRVGDRIMVLSWLDRADRGVLVTRPRDDPANPLTGVFSTRSSDRPNPIGLHRVEILAVDGLRVRVSDMEAIDGTPILDVKPALDAHVER